MIIQLLSITVSDLYSLVKRLDEDFTVTHEVNSALLNEDGTPKVFYHGTNSSDFTVFDSSKSNKRVRLNVLGEGYYFSADKTQKAHTTKARTRNL